MAPRQSLLMSIRAVEAADLQIMTSALPTAAPEVYERRLALQQAGNGHFLAAWYGSEPVGSLLVRWEGVTDRILAERLPGTPHLEALNVREDVRSRGVGTQLLATAEAAARARGCTRIGLAVGIENLRARALYTRLGYRESNLGEFRTEWEYLDEHGQRQIEGETCTYFVKCLHDA